MSEIKKSLDEAFTELNKISKTLTFLFTPLLVVLFAVAFFWGVISAIFGSSDE